MCARTGPSRADGMLPRALVPVLACCAVLACEVLACAGGLFHRSVKPVSVPGIDRHGAALSAVQGLRKGATEKEVLGVLGEPADRRRSCVPGETAWRYPIRAWSDNANGARIVPAPLLRITFDSEGLLSAMLFVDPVTGEPLPIEESLDEATRWFDRLSPDPVPRRIELERSLRVGVSRPADVERLLGEWRPDPGCGPGGEFPILREARSRGGEIREYYVDRPSPLFIPPRYLIASFDDRGLLMVWWLQQTYPGGRK